MRLLTNHPRKIVALEGFGIEVVEQVPVPDFDDAIAPHA
ncbi:MAG: hypothetical protein ABSH37_09635 [Bryobacteraceae bacterium]